MKRSGALRVKLTLLFGIILLIGGGFLLLLANSFAQSAADKAYDRLLASAAFTAMESIILQDSVVHFDLPYASFETLALSPDDRIAYQLKTEAGNVLTGYFDIPPSPEYQHHVKDKNTKQPYFFTALYMGDIFRFVTLQKELRGANEHHHLQLTMGQTRKARIALANDLTLKALIGIVGLIISGWFFIWLAVGWALKPLLAIELDLISRQPTDLHPIHYQVPDEVSHLVKAINGFMERLQINQDRNHAFIAESAHQLRTPLASLQAQAELVLEETEFDKARERTRRIYHNAQRTSNRINQLLNYATLAHRADILLPEPVNIADIIALHLADIAPIAMTQGIELSFENKLGEHYVLADPEALKEVLRNLIDNAIKYGQCSSCKPEIDIGLYPVDEGDWIRLQVRDYGNGLPEHLLSQVTRRFGRGEFRQKPGSGLGLAIVEQIVHQLGGRLELLNGLEVGLKASVLLKRYHMKDYKV